MTLEEEQLAEANIAARNILQESREAEEPEDKIEVEARENTWWSSVDISRPQGSEQSICSRTLAHLGTRRITKLMFRSGLLKRLELPFATPRTHSVGNWQTLWTKWHSVA
jgi:hypothetical protein